MNSQEYRNLSEAYLDVYQEVDESVDIFDCAMEYLIFVGYADAAVDFGIKTKDKPKIASKFFERLKKILDQEKVEEDDKVLAQLINKHFPDFSRIINDCQRSGTIDSTILATFSDIKVNDLIKYLKEKNFPEVTKWVWASLGDFVAASPVHNTSHLFNHKKQNTI